MIAQVVAHIHLFNFSVFIFAFNKNIFEEIVVMLLHLFVTDICDHCKHKQNEMKSDESKNTY